MSAKAGKQAKAELPRPFQGTPLIESFSAGIEKVMELFDQDFFLAGSFFFKDDTA